MYVNLAWLLSKKNTNCRNAAGYIPLRTPCVLSLPIPSPPLQRASISPSLEIGISQSAREHTFTRTYWPMSAGCHVKHVKHVTIAGFPTPDISSPNEGAGWSSKSCISGYSGPLLAATWLFIYQRWYVLLCELSYLSVASLKALSRQVNITGAVARHFNGGLVVCTAGLLRLDQLAGLGHDRSLAQTRCTEDSACSPRTQLWMVPIHTALPPAFHCPPPSISLPVRSAYPSRSGTVYM